MSDPTRRVDNRANVHSRGTSQRHIRVTHNPWVVGSSPTRPTPTKYLVNVVFFGVWQGSDWRSSCPHRLDVARLWHNSVKRIGHGVQLIGNKLA